MWITTLSACLLWKEPDLVVRPLATQFVQPGEDVQLSVDGGTHDVVVMLRSPDGTETPIEAEVVGDQVRLIVPNSPPGAYTLVLRRGEEEDFQPLTIADPNDERPCKRDYQANTGVSAQSGLSFVERFYPDGRRERIEIALAEVEQLEYAFDEEGPCAAILFRKTDGTAILFEDGVEPLLERARTLSEYTGKPLQRP